MENKNMLEKDFKKLFINVKNDIQNTKYKIFENANYELINLYYRIGKVISENRKYGTKFINNLSTSLKLEFPNMSGLSTRNLSRMRVFYDEYKNLSNLPTALANLPWSHNYLLIEKIKDFDTRIWYAKQCYKNGWSHIMLNHQIELNLYERQVLTTKFNNFDRFEK